jgi:hypothetical protein
MEDESLSADIVDSMNEMENTYYTRSLPADNFIAALLKVKQDIYEYFLIKTEKDFEQNIELITDHYPAFLAKWADELCKGPTNIPPPAIPVPDFLKSSLEDLRSEMDKYNLDTSCYWIKSLFITYPYTMNERTIINRS